MSGGAHGVRGDDPESMPVFSADCNSMDEALLFPIAGSSGAATASVPCPGTAVEPVTENGATSVTDWDHTV
jgi:hypothetical protein